MFEKREEIETPKVVTNDIFPDDHKYLTFLKKVFRHEFRKNGFRRISTDILEDWNFRRSAEKGIMSAYLNNNISEEIQPVYYYYMDHFFDKNDKQIEKIGWEIIWENDAILDAISIYITYSVLNQVWLNNTFKIKINSSGIEKEKVKYSEELQSFYENKKHMLSGESLKLLETNPMLLLASEDEDEKIIATQAPAMLKFLKKDSKAHYAKFKEYLDILEIPYEEDHTLVPENDYSTNSIWEFEWNDWEKIGWWARYNKLATKLGNPKDIPATWFYNNIFVIMQMLKDRNIKLKNKDEIDLFFVQLWDEAKAVVLPLSLAARSAWINTVVSLGTPSMKEQMLKANRSNAKFVVLVWLMEARNGIFQVKDTVAWTQEEVKKEELIDYIIWKIGSDKLDFYVPTKDLITE